MLNQYPLWKYLMLAVVLVVGGIYALPNLYEPDPSVQISHRSQALEESDRLAIELILNKAEIIFKSSVWINRNKTDSLSRYGEILGI